MKRIIITCLFCFIYLFSFSQRDTVTNDKPKMVLEAQLFDFNYTKIAAKTVSNNSEVKYYDYFKAWANPSMSQSLTFSANLYAVTHYGLKKMMNSKIFNSPLLDNLTKSITWGTAELLLSYSPLGSGWLHEEYHRAVLTKFNVNSFNNMNTFPLFADAVSVNNVKDEDLIRMKSESNPDFVRLHAAGIEGEYMLVNLLQKYNFFYNQRQTYFTSSLISIFNAFSYVWTCHTEDAEIFTDNFNLEEGTNLKIRDFTGLDFTAWAYDLFHPEEDYTERGIHPSGVGIDRYIKPSDLTIDGNNEPLEYLRKEGFLQLFNFASPMLIGINRFKIKSNIDGATYANFAFRTFLTSFGHDISPLFFVQTPKTNWIFAYHQYKNYEKKFFGFEAEIFDYHVEIAGMNTFSTLRVMAWTQPENQQFKTKKANHGGLVDFKFKFRAKNHAIFPYIQVVAKTEGWVAGNVFLEKNVSIKIGSNINLNCFTHVKLPPREKKIKK